MLFAISLSVLMIGYITSFMIYFKSKSNQNKILAQSFPMFLFWIVLIILSVIAKYQYSGYDLEAFGVDAVLVNLIPTMVITFILGICGAVSSFKKRNTPLMITSVLSMLVIPIPIAIILYPFVFTYIVIKKYLPKKKKA